MNLRKPFIISDGCFSLSEGHTLVEVERVVALSDPYPQVVGQGIDEHLTDMFIVEAATTSISWLPPIAYVHIQVLHNTALRECMKGPNALQLALA